MRELVIGSTGSGKTSMAISFAADGLREGHYRHVFFVVPTRALVKEVGKKFRSVYGDSVFLATADAAVPRRVIENHDVIVATYGKFMGLLRYVTENDLVIFDEVHELDGERELARAYVEEVGADVMLLSATLHPTVVSAYESLGYSVRSLDATVDRVFDFVAYSVREPELVVHGDDAIILEHVGVKGGVNIEATVQTVLRLLGKNRGVIMVYVPFRTVANIVALRIAEAILGERLSVNPRDAESVLRAVMRVGILVHHGGLSYASRDLVLELLNKEWEKYPVLVTCLTLSAGVNFPIEHVVVTEVFTRQFGMMRPDFFHQLIGRAGRGIAGINTAYIHFVVPVVDVPWVRGVLLRHNAVLRLARFADYPYLGEFLVQAIVTFKTMNLLPLLERTISYRVAGEEKRKKIVENYQRAMDKIREVYRPEISEYGLLWVDSADMKTAMSLGITPEEYIEMKRDEELLTEGEYSDYLLFLAGFVQEFYGEGVLVLRFVDYLRGGAYQSAALNVGRLLERRLMYYERENKNLAKEVKKVVYMFYKLPGAPERLVYVRRGEVRYVGFKTLKSAVLAGVADWDSFLRWVGADNAREGG